MADIDIAATNASHVWKEHVADDIVFGPGKGRGRGLELEAQQGHQIVFLELHEVSVD